VIPLLSKELGSSVMRAMNINTANLRRVILERMPEDVLLYNMSQSSNYWGIPDDVIPKRKRGVPQRLVSI
ncbi:MAG: DNA cytosine methyltransferase, partial [Microcystis sp.]